MNLEFGRKLRTLRGARGMTQEQLAGRLGVSPQAVSKWETGAAAPDIGLLPGISVAFGATIDELFCLSDAEHLARVGQLLTDSRDLDAQTFSSAETLLQGILARCPDSALAALRLAELYEHRSETLTRQAVLYAKQAIRIAPEEKSGHSVLTRLLRGHGGDWTQTNTLEMVRYYRGLMKRVPDYQEGWRWLLEQLIGNGSLEEAREIVENNPVVRRHVLAKMWLGDIAYARGDGTEALRLWDECVGSAPDDWRPRAFRADRMVAMGRYGEAIRDYEAWLEKQPAPPYCDPYICMALLYEELRDLPKAIEQREAHRRLLREIGFEQGEAIDGVDREIARLQSALAETPGGKSTDQPT
ncbi:MAG: helix-turn-helix domain-containing protein [Oscillospiraceae bacterium]|jgi:transcriptional regulator with XRE-family HTH domain|nr:helix-turn-helix domain-containing protein [Oscillospiraceae bacterium]